MRAYALWIEHQAAIHGGAHAADDDLLALNIDGDGRVTAWDYHAVHTTTDRPMIGQRGSETPYACADLRAVVSAGPAPLRPGSYRSLGCAVNHFGREVHIDEIASSLGIDPVELRLRNLPDPRYRRVLEVAAEQFGWRTTAAPSGQLAFTDGAIMDSSFVDATFPYLRTPIPGSPNPMVALK